MNIPSGQEIFGVNFSVHEAETGAKLNDFGYTLSEHGKLCAVTHDGKQSYEVLPQGKLIIQFSFGYFMRY